VSVSWRSAFITKRLDCSTHSTRHIQGRLNLQQYRREHLESHTDSNTVLLRPLSWRVTFPLASITNRMCWCSDNAMFKRFSTRVPRHADVPPVFGQKVDREHQKKLKAATLYFYWDNIWFKFRPSRRFLWVFSLFACSCRKNVGHYTTACSSTVYDRLFLNSIRPLVPQQ
jgi:hypothetical protein